MACVKRDGTLTTAAAAALEAAREGVDEAGLAEALARPLFQARAIMREMRNQGFAEERGGLFFATKAGLDKLAAARTASG